MRVTKKVIAKVVNDYFERIEMPFEVDPKEIEATRYTSDQYEAGATHHFIPARHKENPNQYNYIQIYTMQTMGSMTDELKRFKGMNVEVKNYGRNRKLDLWVVIQ